LHLPLSGRRSRRDQPVEQGASEPHAAPVGQHHQGELGDSVGSNVFAVTYQLTVRGECQGHDAVATLSRDQAVEQGQVGGLAVGEVAFVETGGIHPAQEVGKLGSV
jgi:hypothetical protein